jgi:hypothetical protein
MESQLRSSDCESRGLDVFLFVAKELMGAPLLHSRKFSLQSKGDGNLFI